MTLGELGALDTVDTVATGNSLDNVLHNVGQVSGSHLLSIGEIQNLLHT